jgi:hypothetical protein
MKKSVLTLAILVASMSVSATSYKQPSAEASAVAGASAQSNLQNSNKSINNLNNLNNLSNRSSNLNNNTNLNNLSNRSSNTNSNRLSTGDSTAINTNRLSTGDSISKSVNTLSTGAATATSGDSISKSVNTLSTGDSNSSVNESNNNANIGASNSITFEAERNTPDLSLSNVQPTIPCAIPVNASGVATAFGLGFGTAYIDKACEERELIRLGLASGDSNTNSLANVVLQKRLAEILKPEAKEEDSRSNYEAIMGW